MIWCIKTYIIAYVKVQKNEDILSIMLNLQPNCCLKIDFQKVDQPAGGKWLIHDTKRCKDNKLQSLKYAPEHNGSYANIEWCMGCREYRILSRMRWFHILFCFLHAIPCPDQAHKPAKTIINSSFRHVRQDQSLLIWHCGITTVQSVTSREREVLALIRHIRRLFYTRKFVQKRSSLVNNNRGCWFPATRYSWLSMHEIIFYQLLLFHFEHRNVVNSCGFSPWRLLCW